VFECRYWTASDGAGETALWWLRFYDGVIFRCAANVEGRPKTAASKGGTKARFAAMTDEERSALARKGGAGAVDKPSQTGIVLSTEEDGEECTAGRSYPPESTSCTELFRRPA
jgi:hypothetical protein